MISSPQEILQRHGIAYMATRSGKFTTDCPNCGGGGYLNVTHDREGVAWFCHQCEQGGGEKFEQRTPPQIIRPKGDGGLGKPAAIYDYRDEGGGLLFQTMRFEPPGQPKQFRQRKGPDQEKWSIKGCRIVPFMLPELLADLAADRVVFVAEGEKDVLTLRDRGVPATTNPMGAGKWWPEFNKIFTDADVIVVGDHDKPGREHVQLVANNLKDVCKRLRVLDLAMFWEGIEVSADITDFLQREPVEVLWQIVADLPEYQAPTLNGNGNGHSKGNGEPAPQPPGAPELRPILSKAQFLADFVPPIYLIEGVLQRRYIYALTGQTGHAKTAVALLLARLVGSGDPDAMLKNHRVEKGRVVYFVGENPDDVRMRVIGSDSQRTDNPMADNVWYIPGMCPIAGMLAVLKEDCKKHGEISLIIIDTSAAYFLGTDELANTQMGNYARLLRQLTQMPGGPCVVVLCHPVKHVEKPEQLLPRGGGAYLAEMDGNLTLWKKDGDLIELNYNKMRGPGFAPITFRLDTIRTDKLVDDKGRELPTVMAVAIEDSEEESRVVNALADEDLLLTKILLSPDGSLSGWARDCGWVGRDGEPYKMKVQRIVTALAIQTPKLCRKLRGNKWTLTDEGKDTARKASLKALRERDEVPESL